MAARVIYHDFSSNNKPLSPRYDPALLAIVEIIRDGLIRDSYVRLHKFGTFRLKWSKPGQGRNPRTGEHISWPAQPRITFTPAKHLKELVEPDPQPVIPLDEPVVSDLQEQQPHDAVSRPAIDPVTVDPENSSQAPPQKDEIPLLKNIPDVLTATKMAKINDRDNPPDCDDKQAYVPQNYRQAQQETASETILSDELISHESANTNLPEHEQRPARKRTNKKKAILGAGMLALVPAIIFMLQSDLSQKPLMQSVNNGEPQTGIQTPAAITSQVTLTPDELEIEPAETAIISDSGFDTTTANTETEVAAETATVASEFYLAPQVHNVMQNDNLWSLAEKYLGDAYLWPLIYRANARILDNPDKLAVGKQLVIPGLQNQPDAMTANDKQLAAEAYFLLYEFFLDKKSPNAHHFLIGAKKFDPQWLNNQKSSVIRKHRKYIK